MLYAAKVQQLEDEVIPVGVMPVDADHDHPFGAGWEVFKF
jgi:hypothetical protein